MNQRRETPNKRVNPGGKTVWQARPRDIEGNKVNRGTFAKKGPCREIGRSDCCAQHAIDAFYEARSMAPQAGAATLGSYAATWTELHPRSDRTNRSNKGRVNATLDIVIDGRRLRDWRFIEVTRREANLVINHLFREQKRAVKGVRGVMGALSAMANDAADDGVIGANPFTGLKIRANDPRVVKDPREPTIWTFEQMHAFAAAAADVRTQKATYVVKHGLDAWRPVYAEAMIRMLSDCGLRLGEMLALQRGLQDLKSGVFTVQGSAWEGKIVPSNPHKNHDRQGPIPASTLELLKALPPRIDTPLLFPTPSGQLWRERNFRRDVWDPAQTASNLMCLPHDMRHSWVSEMAAAGIDQDDLARVAGHSVLVQQGVYRHSLGRSDDAIRKVIG